MKERKAEEFIVEEQKSDSPRINKLLSKKITLASLLIALAGCSSFDARPVPLIDFLPSLKEWDSYR